MHKCCLFCDFDETVDMYREDGKTYILCPNHHALITRGIKTLDQLISEDSETKENCSWQRRSSVDIIQAIKALS